MTAVPTYIKRTSDRYLRRLAGGERIMRTAAGKIQWATGGKISRKPAGEQRPLGLRNAVTILPVIEAGPDPRIPKCHSGV